MWRRTLDGWGYSPLDQIDRGNVGDLRMVWSRGLGPGLQQGTPLVHDGVMYMPNPRDVIQAIDGATGDLLWEYRRDLPDDLRDYMLGALTDLNRNLAIYGTHIIDTSGDDYVFALDAATGELAWETEILDYRVNPANQSSGPIIANGKIVSGRGCTPRGGPNACVIVAHDAVTGEELWRRRTIPRPRRARRRDLGRGALRGAQARRRVDGAQLRPRAEPRLHRHVGDLARPQVPHRRGRPAAPLPQLDPRPRRRHRRDRLVLPAPQRQLGSRPPVRAHPRRHRGDPEPGGGRVDQPPPAAGRGAPGHDRHPRQDRHRLHPRPRHRRVPVGAAHGGPERGGRHRRRDRRRLREPGGRVPPRGPGGLRVPDPHRRQGLGARRLQPPHQRHVLPPAQRLRAHHGDQRRLPLRARRPQRDRPRHRPGRHRPGHLRRDRRAAVDSRAARRHQLAHGHRRRPRLRRRLQRPLPRPRPRDRRGPLGDQHRLAGHRLPRHLRPRGAPVRRGQHRPLADLRRLQPPDPRAAPEQRQHAVRLRWRSSASRVDAPTAQLHAPGCWSRVQVPDERELWHGDGGSKPRARAGANATKTGTTHGKTRSHDQTQASHRHPDLPHASGAGLLLRRQDRLR